MKIKKFLFNPIILIDTREKQPWLFHEFETKRATLDCGDYSIEGFENIVVIERKSGQDFLLSITHDLKRFQKELTELARFPYRAILVEDDIKYIYQKSNFPESYITERIASILTNSCPVYFLSSRGIAQTIAQRLLIIWYLKLQKVQK